MKYKQVFFIWLLADAFLLFGTIIFAMYQSLFSGMVTKEDWGILFLIIGAGICVSLPSLGIMMLFHFVFTKKAADTTAYRIPYLALIIGINMLYLLFGRYVYGMTPEFDIFYIGSTLAGLLAFYLVDRRSRKVAAVNY